MTTASNSVVTSEENATFSDEDHSFTTVLSPAPGKLSTYPTYKLDDREIRNCLITSQITHIRFGRFNNAPAVLMVFKFRFQALSHGVRFRGITLKVRFTALPPDSPAAVTGAGAVEHPEILDNLYRPRTEHSVPVTASIGTTATVSNSASLDPLAPLGMQGLLTLQTAKEKGITKAYSDDFCGRLSGSVTRDKWKAAILCYTIVENELTKSGIPVEFCTAMVVRTGNEAGVGVEVDYSNISLAQTSLVGKVSEAFGSAREFRSKPKKLILKGDGNLGPDIAAEDGLDLQHFEGNLQVPDDKWEREMERLAGKVDWRRS